MRLRQPAWRILASELNDSGFEHRDEGEFAPNFIITPLGAMVNRVYFVGTLGLLESSGGDDGNPFYRGQIMDPTGRFHISCGQHQPEALRALQDIEVPARVAVVGKIRTFTLDSGGLRVGVRPEIIRPVDRDAQEYWLFDAVRHMRGRIEYMDEAMRMGEPNEEKLLAIGAPKRLIDGILRSVELYGSVDLNKYRSQMVSALSFILEGDDGGDGALPDYEPEEKAGSETELLESAIMDYLRLGGSGGVPYEDILQEMQDKKLSEGPDLIEEALDELRNQGLIYEQPMGTFHLI